MNHNVFDNVGFGKKNKYEAAMSLYGVQVNAIENNIFNKTKGLRMHLVVGEPIVNVFNNNFYESDRLIVTGDEKYNVQNLWDFNPGFDGQSYELLENSQLKGRGTDSLDLGVFN